MASWLEKIGNTTLVPVFLSGLGQMLLLMLCAISTLKNQYFFLTPMDLL